MCGFRVAKPTQLHAVWLKPSQITTLVTWYAILGDILAILGHLI